MKAIVLLGFVLGAALGAEASMYSTRPGQRVILECGIPTYRSSLVWLHGNQNIFFVAGKTGLRHNGPATIQSRSKVRGSTDLSITDVRREDAGKFTCKADGVSNQHTLLVVTVSASPSEELQQGSSAKLQCDVQGLEPDSSVKWTRPDGRPHEGSHSLHLSGVALSDAGTWACVFSCEGSVFKETLEIKVKAPAPVTSTLPPKGGSEVNNATCSNCDPAPEPWAAQLSWWVWAAAGAGLAVLVLLMVIVVVLCAMTRRRKKKQRMRKSRKPLQPNQYCQCNCPAAAAVPSVVAKPRRARRNERPSTLALKPLLME